MFKTTIGLEIHVQLKTKSKMFCGCDNSAYAKASAGKNAENAAPNSLVCPICLGMPGVLPVANRQAIEWVLMTGLALSGRIADSSKFDRKHYFYPDLPKNYQISQYDKPFVLGGFLEIETPSGSKKINLTRIHLEEDAGKLIHSSDSSLVDLNRAGTPLMEIVTEPEISTPTDAKIFMQELRSILRYLDVSDADMEKGHLRCDANISIMQDQKSKIKNQNDNVKIKNLGTPIEIKNLNSFRMVERALLYEEKRQRELLEKGEKIIKETRGWSDQKGISYSQRSKETSEDYRYFPEPDIPPFELKKAYNTEELKNHLPELPAQKRKKYVEEFSLPRQHAAILTQDLQMANYFEKVTQKISPKLAANWVINELKMDGLLLIAPENLIELLAKIEAQEITGKMAKEIFAEMLSGGKKSSQIIAEKGFRQLGDEETLDKIIENVILENPRTVQDFQKGKTAALGFLVGVVMSKTQGQANPQIVNEILKEKLKG